MNLTHEIESRIQRFIGELNELLRKQALQAVSDALTSNGAPVRRGPGRPPGPRPAVIGTAAPAPLAPKATRGRGRRRGEKRTQQELAQLENTLESHVRSNPGQGIEAIGKAVGFDTGELSRPMKKLIERGAIRTEGAKRATKYFIGGGGASVTEDGAKRGRIPGAVVRRKAKKR
jgi:hypothetical protein